LNEEEEEPVPACELVHLCVLAEVVQLDVPLVEGLVLLLFLLEQIDVPRVDRPLSLVVHLHDVQGRHVISVVVV
jgi:hypothetical protein